MSTPAAQTTMQCMEVWGGNRLVNTSVTMPGLDAWVYSKPFGESGAGGGDVHYVSSCATGRVTRLLLADVSGHGARVCNVADNLRTLMRRYVNYIDQAEFVRSMNRQFTEMSASECFATAVVTTFFAPTNSLSLCNAGHPPPLLYRGRGKTWEYLELAQSQCAGHDDDNNDDDDDEEPTPANIPLGVQDVAEYEQFDVDLEPGDLVLCYTDALPEARESNRALLLGQDGLIQIVRRLNAAEPASLIPELLSRIAARCPGNLDSDDVTALLFRPTGTATQPALRDKLLAPVRVARGVLSSLRPGGGPAPMPEFTVTNIGGAILDSLNRRRRRRQ